MRVRGIAACVGAMLLTTIGFAPSAFASPRDPAPPGAARQVDHGRGVDGQASRFPRRGSNGITYHGGPVMTAGVNVVRDLVRQLVRQHRHDASWPNSRRASAVRPTSTSTPPTTTAANSHGRRTPVKLRAADHRQLLAGHRLSDAPDPGTIVSAAITAAACPRTPTASTSCSPRPTSRDERLLHAVLRLAHARHDRRQRHQVLVRRQPRRCPRACSTQTTSPRTATPAPTAWPRSSRTSSRRRSPIPTSTPGTTAAAPRTPTSARGRSAPHTRRRTAPRPT